MMFVSVRRIMEVQNFAFSVKTVAYVAKLKADLKWTKSLIRFMHGIV